MLYQWIVPDGDLYEQARRLRNKVLLQPIGLPDFAWEKRDAQSHHLVALNECDVVGCVLLRPLEDGGGQLLQMAVASSHQRRGLGGKLVHRLLERARALGLSHVMCHSRESARGFYANHGFQPEGEPFEEVGVAHIRMSVSLS